MTGSVIVLIVVGVFLMMGVGIYNGLVGLRNKFKASFANIDTELKRRHDLIPNLVETAKAFMSHERETLEAVIQARNQAVSAGEKAAANPTDPSAMQGMMAAEGLLTGSMGKLFALMENYPDIKSDQTMTKLMDELSTTENRIGSMRQSYNNSVMNYNTAREKFPNVIIANFCNFQAAESFEITNPAEREAPKVSF